MVFLSQDDMELLTALRAGDEAAFTLLVERYHENMVRIAALYVRDAQIAQEVAQETWVAMLNSLDRFEGRSSLKTWLFSILTNRAKTRASREDRYVPLALTDELDDEPSVPAHRFYAPGELHADHWTAEALPQLWDPEAALLVGEINAVLEQAIDALPAHQRAVIRLHDIEGFTSEEICNILQISATNQRVLLHRARSRARAALEAYFKRES